MCDQPLTIAILDQFFRSFARPELDRLVEERMEESRERGRRLYVRSVVGSLDFLEVLYRFLQDDVRRLEQRLDESHVLIERDDCRGLPGRLETSRYKHEDALAARSRLEGYLAGLVESIDRIDNRPAKDSLQEQAMDLRRRVQDLAAPLDIAGRRRDRYDLSAGAPAVEPRTSGGTEER